MRYANALVWCVAHLVHYVIAHHIFVDPSTLIDYCAGIFVL